MSETAWSRQTFSDSQVEFDPYTTTEGVFVTSGCLLTIAGGCLSIGALAEQDARYLLGTLILGALAAVAFTIYSKLSDTIVVDFDDSVIRPTRVFWGRRFGSRKIPFEAVHCVFVEAQATRSDRRGPLTWKYGLALALNNGRKLTLTALNKGAHSVAQTAGERLAKRMGLGLFAGCEERIVSLKGKNPPELVLEKRS